MSKWYEVNITSKTCYLVEVENDGDGDSAISVIQGDVEDISDISDYDAYLVDKDEVEFEKRSFESEKIYSLD